MRHFSFPLTILLFSLIASLFSPGVIAQEHRTLHVKKAGTMVEQLTEAEANRITHLTLTGKLNAIDFRHLRDEFESLMVLDLSGASIKLFQGKRGTYIDGAYYVYPARCVPAYAFCTKVGDNYVGKKTLRQVILPDDIINIEDGAFRGCTNLRILQLNTESAPNLLPYALADSITAVFTRPGCSDSYRTKKGWGAFAVLEANPTEATVAIAPEGNLATALIEAGVQPADVNFLTVAGKMDDADFLLLRDYMPNLVGVDLEGCTAESIPEFAFTQKKYLLRVVLPRGLKHIGQRAFSGCRRLCGPIMLPPSMTTIDMGAFMGCERLREVVITGGPLAEVGDKLFEGGPGRISLRK